MFNKLTRFIFAFTAKIDNINIIGVKRTYQPKNRSIHVGLAFGVSWELPGGNIFSHQSISAFSKASFLFQRSFGSSPRCTLWAVFFKHLFLKKNAILRCTTLCVAKERFPRHSSWRSDFVNFLHMNVKTLDRGKSNLFAFSSICNYCQAPEHLDYYHMVL